MDRPTGTGTGVMTAPSLPHPVPTAGGPAPDPSQRARGHLDRNPASTPAIVIDLDVVAARYRELTRVLPAPRVFYAVKANPHPDVLRLLAGLGSAFDVASIGEVRACLAAGAAPESLSFGNTVKKARDIAEAHRLGVRRFAFDSCGELDKLVAAAPGSTAFCRLACDGRGAAWPLSGKFGCGPDDAAALLVRAAVGGLRPGVSFHVGSQQSEPAAWDRNLETVARLRAGLRAHGVELGFVNIGGGFPGSYRDATAGLEEYGAVVGGALDRHLGPAPPPELVMEPGRVLVADAGVMRTEVVGVSRRQPDGPRWVYLDAGMFSGLIEALDEAIRYRVAPVRPRAGATGRVVLAGPTCDSADVLYRRTPYELPLDLAPGDLVDILSVGAYSITYSTVGFNGFGPPGVHVLAPTGS